MASVLPQPRSFITSLFNSLSNDRIDPANDPPPSPSTPPSNPLLSASPATKPLFLTLHCLFPTELLPALDLLDRKLVTRVIYHPGPSLDRPNPDNPGESTKLKTQSNPSNHPTNPATNATDPATTTPSGTHSVYYVRSSRPRSTSRSRYHSTTPSTIATSYEVRLTAWNCTCAAFTFSAFSTTLSLRDDDDVAVPGSGGAEGKEAEEGGGEGEGRRGGKAGREGQWRFGGLTREREGVPTPVCKHLLACVLVEECAALGPFVEERVVGRGGMAGWGGGWGG